MAEPLFTLATFGLLKRKEESQQTATITETLPAMGLPPTLGWELISSGTDGPGPRSRHCFAYDPRAQAAVLFGGIVWSSKTLKGDTWELRDRQWRRIRSADGPPVRHRGAMVYLNHRQRSLLFGGQTSRGAMLADTWTYSRQRWQELSTHAAPSPRCGHAMAFDESAKTAVLFGGIRPGDHPLSDTWIFDGSAWQPVTGTGPPARRYAAFAYDPGHKGCVLHGGAEDDHGKLIFGETGCSKITRGCRLARSFTPRPEMITAWDIIALPGA